MDEIKVIVADDHTLVRMGLIALLESESDIRVVGEAANGEEAVRKALDLRPDVVITDLMMPGLDGIETTRRLREADPGIRILILTTSTSSDDLAHALEAGAGGAVTKSSENQLLLTAIRSVAAGRKFVSKDISDLIASDPPAPDLTPRQLQILDSITRGLTNTDIGRQLGISPDRVKVHSMAIFQKLGAANRAEAVAIALRKHLLKI